MRRLRLVVALLALLSLTALGAEHAGGTTATVSGNGAIVGTGTSYALRITNTGTEPIKCWRLTLPAGVMATAIGRPPAGWQVGAPGPPPQPILAGQSAAGIPPGGSGDFPFTTDKAFPTGLTSTLRISGDCRTDADAPVTGPSGGGGGTPPPPKSKPCLCKNLTTFIDPGGFELVGRLNERSMRLKLRLDWRLRCTVGAGTCKAELEPGLTFDEAHSKELKLRREGSGVGGLAVSCKGRCAETTSGYVRLVALGGDGYGFRERKIGAGGPAVYISVTQVCQKKKVIRDFEIRFDREGRVDFEESDLNGNGRRDGKEK